MLKILSILASIVLITGCGRIGAPVAPYFVAPQAVQNLSAEKVVDGVKLSWVAPEKDRRGKRLKELESYLVYRADLSQNFSKAGYEKSNIEVMPKEKEFQLLGNIPDYSAERLAKKISDLQEDHKPVRGVSLEQQDRAYFFLDRTVANNRTYIYKVVAANQSGIEGDVGSRIRVSLENNTPIIIVLPAIALEQKEELAW